MAGSTSGGTFARNAVVLGLLTATGPFAIDMYLPSLPQVGASLGASPGAVLASMTAFFIAFALGQLVYGPVSDLIGRRPPLFAGMLLFAAASVGCALAGSIETLIAFRLVQGFGGAAGMIIARAIVRDLHSGVEEARMLSLLMLVFSVSPLLAPLVGNGVLAVASWRGVFWVVTALALAGVGLAAAFVPETHRPEQRGDGGFGAVLAACGRLLSDREYVGLTLLSAFAMSGFFIFLGNSPFVLARHYGLSPLEYSVAFSVNAAAFFVAAQFNGKLGARFGLRRLIRPALAGYATVLIVLVALTAAHIDHLAVVMGLLFVAYGFLGVILPVASVLALAEHGEIAGTASSLMSAIQLGLGSLMIAVSGKLNDGTITVFVGSIAACGVAALVLGAVSLRAQRLRGRR